MENGKKACICAIALWKASSSIKLTIGEAKKPLEKKELSSMLH
jgi:hypothetical protein